MDLSGRADDPDHDQRRRDDAGLVRSLRLAHRPRREGRPRARPAGRRSRRRRSRSSRPAAWLRSESSSEASRRAAPSRSTPPTATTRSSAPAWRCRAGSRSADFSGDLGAAKGTPLFWGHGVHDDKVLFPHRTKIGVDLLTQRGVRRRRSQRRRWATARTPTRWRSWPSVSGTSSFPRSSADPTPRALRRAPSA